MNQKEKLQEILKALKQATECLENHGYFVAFQKEQIAQLEKIIFTL